MKEYTIFDEDGILGIVDPSLYNGFINSEWELEDIIHRFVDEMNQQHLIVWRIADYGDDWKINIAREESSQKSFREFHKTIEVTSGELYFIDYTSLTMVAQFLDKTIDEECQHENKISLENGMYNIQIRQMFDPDDYEFVANSRHPHFEIVIKKEVESANSVVDSVYWWAD